MRQHLEHRDVALGVLLEARQVLGDLVGEGERATLGQEAHLDEIAVREGSKALGILETAKEFAGGLQSVTWIDINRDTLSGKIIALPKREDIQLPVNEQLIVELYSK